MGRESWRGSRLLAMKRRGGAMYIEGGAHTACDEKRTKRKKDGGNQEGGKGIKTQEVVQTGATGCACLVG